ncbi:MAG: NAD-dependent epimerase/dehydratase family protein [Anaerolineae bacterium]|nr:NAD-dependent epimerase/dehydratase family protein [Anaerolineae bacterium]
MALTGKKVLVTGGAGFVGSHLAERLIALNPASLTIVDNFFLGRMENLENIVNDIQVVRMDASDLSAMRQIVRAEKIDVVFDLAVIPLPTSLEYPAWTVQTNVAIATTFCELARFGDIDTLIHCSSSEAYGTAQVVPMTEEHPLAAITPYAASKAAADQVVLSYCRTFGIDATIVRPFNQFGPRQNDRAYAGIIPIVINRVTQGLPVEIFGDGKQTRDYIFVRDTTDFIVKAYSETATRGQVINVGSGREITINELVQKLLAVMHANDHPVIHTHPRPGDVRQHCAGIEKARQMLGVNPPGVTHENLNETVEWYLKAKSA